LVLLVGGVMIASRMLRAQQKAMPVIGYLSSFSPPANLGDLGRSPSRQGLGETGFVEGQNAVLEYCWAEAIMIGCPRWPPTLSVARSI
jgi:putative ABC transport system substrate-binding protein